MADTPSIIGGIAREMKFLAERQRVIAENIANNDTAGFKARELPPPSFADLLAAQQLDRGGVPRPRVEATPTMRALGARTGGRGRGATIDRDIAETKPNGNTVSLEEQLLKMGQIQADFATMTNLYRRHQALLRTALGRGGG